MFVVWTTRMQVEISSKSSFKGMDHQKSDGSGGRGDEAKAI